MTELDKAEPEQTAQGQQLPDKFKKIKNFPSPHMAQARATLHIVDPDNHLRSGKFTKEQIQACRLMRSFARMGFPFLKQEADDLADISVSEKGYGIDMTVKGLNAVNQTNNEKGKLQKLHDFITGQG